MRSVILIFGLLSVVCVSGEISPETLKCKLDIATPSWLNISAVYKELVVDAEPKLKPFLEVLSNELKGLADIVNALPAPSTLTPEARYKLNSFCIMGSLMTKRIHTTVIASQHPQFYVKHTDEIKKIEQLLSDMEIAIAKCA